MTTAAIWLFLSAFAAATILPFSSEAALLAALLSGMDKQTALLAASCGNILAITVNFALGYWLSSWSHRKIVHSKVGQRVFLWSKKYGYSVLFLSPLPIIGDPITLAAGVLRLNIWIFLLLAGGLRVLRYWMISLTF